MLLLHLERKSLSFDLKSQPRLQELLSKTNGLMNFQRRSGIMEHFLDMKDPRKADTDSSTN